LAGDRGEALFVVLEGELEIELGEKRHVLKEGEALHFRAHDPHVLRSRADGVRLLWIMRPPFGGPS
jgi:quercetin dioxygenase-like cupin family protein